MAEQKIIDYAGGVESIQNQVKSCIQAHQSFSVVNVDFGKQSTVVDIIEKAIEGAGLSCRVRTANRGWAVAALSVATLGTGAVAAAAIAGHDLATINPDYEVVKEMIGSNVAAVYQK